MQRDSCRRRGQCIPSVAETGIAISEATEADIPLILSFIKDLAEYEKLSHAVEATEEKLGATLFSVAKVLIATWEGDPAGFALFFPTYSTFLAKPGIYLEDLFVKPHLRGKGIGRALLKALAEKTEGRLEWSVLDWNEPSIRFYKSLGAKPMDDWTMYRLEK